VATDPIFKKYSVDPACVPAHVAVVMDGNGRWAKARFLPRSMGHRAGVKSLRTLVSSCATFGVKHVSVFAFSTENWNRSSEEVQFLMAFFKEMLSSEIQALKEKLVRVRIVGDVSKFDEALQAQIAEVHAMPPFDHVMQLNIMMNYGSRDEIVTGVARLVDQARAHPEMVVTEEAISGQLYTAGIPDPDILIRTSGEHRLSNFLLWQLAYTELFFLEVLWPDFTQDHLGDVLCQYQKRDRRFGK